MSDTATFEERLKELESIITTIEAGTLPLKDLVAVHQRGKILLDSLEAELKQAEQHIEVVNIHTDE